MDFIAFLFVWLFIHFFAILPMRIAYWFADVVFILIYYFPGYRKKIVFNNLKSSFPSKSAAERKAIARKFYRNLADQIIESIKSYTMSHKELKKRVYMTNHSIYQPYLAKNSDMIIVAGHYGSWELCAVSMCLQIPFTVVGVYMPIGNRFIEKLIKQKRSRSGMWLEPAKTIAENMDIIPFKPNAVVLVSDQSPANPKSGYWMPFLHHDTQITIGAERLAKRSGRPVLFVEVNKIKRGYYSVTLHMIADNPLDAPKYSITEKHVRLLEKIILKKPELWLWSHKRWKHKRPAD